MLVKIIEDALVVGLVVGCHLLQIVLPGVEIVLFAGSSDPSAQREIHRPEYFRGRVGLFDHRGVLLAQGNNRVVVGLVRFDVTVRVAPSSGFVVQLVVGNASVRGCAECRQQMLHPALLQRDGVVDVIGVDVGVD